MFLNAELSTTSVVLTLTILYSNQCGRVRMADPMRIISTVMCAVFSGNRLLLEDLD